MQALQPYYSQFLLALLALAAIQFLCYLSLSGRMKRTNRALRSALLGPDGADLEAMLARCLEESARALNRSDEFEARLQEQAETMRSSVQKIGLVRYDAYGDVSGTQSFSLALLDDHLNGTLLTGLMGRNDGRCFSKIVLSGQSEQTLSEEENDALKMAIGGGLRAFSNSSNSERKREKR